MQDPEDLTADILLLPSLSVTASPSSKLSGACAPIHLVSPQNHQAPSSLLSWNFSG